METVIQVLRLLCEEHLAFQVRINPCVSVKTLEDESRLYLLLYVDDMLIACKSKKVVQELKAGLSREFEMKDLGLARKILGIKIFKN